ncbi:MAG: M4 family metallopeptidase [Kofleriaceae bacterium]|nr:M4 family metallopeptidase [Kofleriaceae bacterium]
MRLRSASIATLIASCTTGCQSQPPPIDKDVDAALADLPNANIIQRTDDGMPSFITGTLAYLGVPLSGSDADVERELRGVLSPVIAPFHLRVSDLVLRRVSTDEQGARHFRYQQTANGLFVVGGDLIVHVDSKGVVFAVNGTARGQIDPNLGVSGRLLDEAVSMVNKDQRFVNFTLKGEREVYLVTADGSVHRTFEISARGQRDGVPADDLVYVDATTLSVVDIHPKIHQVKSRRISSANNTTTLPGTLRRVEGQGPISESVVDGTFVSLGLAYNAYAMFWLRDSYNNLGADILSSVHYDNNVCNAFWDGTRIVFGDGNGTTCFPLGQAVDVAAHEFTHAVTDYESGLVYSNESGGMNESMSDAFGAFVEAYADGGDNGTLRLSEQTWALAEDVRTTPLRWMCDPSRDNASADYWYNGVGSLNVHYSSGIGNLAFCLLTRGGSHPRGDSSVLVTGVGMDKAIRILYKAQRDIITSNANYAAIRTAMEQAAIQTGNDQATIDAVSCAWAAVGVGSVPSVCGRSDILWQNTDGTVAVWTMNRGSIVGQYYPGAVTSDWTLGGVGEFNGDGKSDILWRNTNGTLAIWHMNGGTKVSDGYPGVIGSEWALLGIGDFNGGGSDDILWRHTNGTVATWIMSNSSKVGENYMSTQTATLAGIGDFDRDGISDILWRNSSGTVSLWFMKNGTINASATVGTESSDWMIKGVGDFNDDGKADILWRNIDGTVAIWFMDGAVHNGGTYPGQPGNDWVVQRVGDFDGNGTSDILWRNTNGTVAIWFMSNGLIASQSYPGAPGNDWQIRGAAQFN